MFAYVISDTVEEKICLIFIPRIFNLCNGDEVNLVLNQKQIAFKAINDADGIFYLKKIKNVSDYYCPDKNYDAFVKDIYDWDKLQSLAK